MQRTKLSTSASATNRQQAASFLRRHRPPPTSPPTPRPAAKSRTSEILAFFDAAVYRRKPPAVILSLARKLREHLIREGIETESGSGEDDPRERLRRRPSASEADALLASALKIARIDRAFRAMLSPSSSVEKKADGGDAQDAREPARSVRASSSAGEYMDPVDAALRLADLLPPRAEIRLALLNAAAKANNDVDVAGIVKVAEACSSLARRLRNPEYGLSPEVADDAGTVAILVASTSSLRWAKSSRERRSEEEGEEDEEEESLDDDNNVTETLIRSTIELALSRCSSSPAVLASALVALVELGDAPSAFSTYAEFRRLCRSQPETRTFHALLRAARLSRNALKVRRVYDRLQRGLHGPRARPSERTSTLALSAAAAAGERDVGWILGVYSSGVEAFGGGGEGPSTSADFDAAAALVLAVRSAGTPPEAAAAAFAVGSVVRLHASTSTGVGVVDEPLRRQQQQQQNNGKDSNRQSLSWLHAELLQLAASSGEPERAVALWAAAAEDGVTSFLSGGGEERSTEGEEVEEGGGGNGETSSSPYFSPSVSSPAYLFSALFKCVAAGGGSPELQLLGDAVRAELRHAWLLEKRNRAEKKKKRSPSCLTTRDALVAHNAAMAALAAGARVAEARALLDNMTDAASAGGGPTPDAVSFNCVLDAAAQAGDVDAAFDAYRAMIEEGERRSSSRQQGGREGEAFSPGVESYGALMHAAARAASPADAELVLRAMRAAGVEASVQVFTSYMAALVAGNSSGSGSGNGNNGPKNSAYSAAPSTPSASEVASAVLARMRAEGLSPTAVTFGVCLQAAEQSGDVNGALRFYADALRSAVAPTDECHAKLLRVATGHRPSSERTLNEVIGVLRRLIAGNQSGGIKGRTTKPSSSLSPEVRDATLNSLARALASAGQLPRASRILTLLRSLDGVLETPTLGTMLRAAAAGARLDEAESYYDELRSRGVRARRRDASALVVALCDAGRLGDALRIYADMAREDAPLMPPLMSSPPFFGSGATTAAASASSASTSSPSTDKKNKPPRVKPRSSERTRSSSREWDSASFGGGGGDGGRGGGAPSAAVALVSALASEGDIDAARSLYLTSGLREGARRAYSSVISSSSSPPHPSLPSNQPQQIRLPPPPGIERAWAALIEAACHASRPTVALLAFDDWRAAADAADAAGAKPPELSPALLAFLEATCRNSSSGSRTGSSSDEYMSLRVLDVLSALRTMQYRAAQSALASAPKASHHVRGWIEEAEDEGVEEEERERRKRGMSVRVVPNDSDSEGSSDEREREIPLPGSAAAAVAARRAALASPEVVAARRAAALVAARAALRKRLAERRRLAAEKEVEGGATATATATAEEEERVQRSPLPTPPTATSTDEGDALARPRPAAPKLTAEAARQRNPRDRPRDDDGFDWSSSEGEEDDEKCFFSV